MHFEPHFTRKRRLRPDFAKGIAKDVQFFNAGWCKRFCQFADQKTTTYKNTLISKMKKLVLDINIEKSAESHTEALKYTATWEWW